jgi:effector-binding domain-containing protein
MNLVSIISFSLLIVFILVFVYLILKLTVQKKQLLGIYIQSEMDKHLLIQKLDELSKELSARELSETDGFVKFISQSRDWAFEYIEEVQKALAEFDEEVAPRLEWATTFGRVAGDTIHTDTINKISEAYNKLKTLLPENNETPNN